MVLTHQAQERRDALIKAARNKIFETLWVNKNVQKYLVARSKLFNEYKKIEWDVPDATRLRLARLYKTNPIYKETANIDLTFRIIDYFHTRKITGKNIITETNGFPRSGKSWANIFFASIADNNFSIDRVFYSKTDTLVGEGLLNGIKSAKPQQSYLLDEQQKVWGTGQIRIESQFQNLIEIVGKRMLNFHFCSPTPRGYGVCEYNFRTLYQSRFPEGWTKLIVDDGDHEPIGRMITPDPTIILGEEFMRQYEAKKDEFIDFTLDSKIYSTQDEQAIRVVYDDSFAQDMSKSEIKALINIVLPELKSNKEAADLASYIFNVIHMRGKGLEYFSKLRNKAIKSKQRREELR